MRKENEPAHSTHFIQRNLPAGSREKGGDVMALCNCLAARGSNPSACGTRIASSKLRTLRAVFAYERRLGVNFVINDCEAAASIFLLADTV